MAKPAEHRHSSKQHEIASQETADVQPLSLGRQPWTLLKEFLVSRPTVAQAPWSFFFLLCLLSAFISFTESVQAQTNGSAKVTFSDES
jgi:hypothetical protein